MKLAEGLIAKKDFADFRKWETAQKKLIEGSQAGKHGYNKSWCKQRLADIAKAREHGVMFVATGRKRVELRHLILAPETLPHAVPDARSAARWWSAVAST